MPRLAACSRDLHWHWINWTLLCDTMEVSMLRLAWLPIAHSMCSSPHWQVGSSWFREKLSPANRNKGYRGEQISRKFVSRELNARSYRDFAKNIVFGRHVCKIHEIGGQNMGSNMRPRYIQFRDIHDRDISGLHCINKWRKMHLYIFMFPKINSARCYEVISISGLILGCTQPMRDVVAKWWCLSLAAQNLKPALHLSAHMQFDGLSSRDIVTNACYLCHLIFPHYIDGLVQDSSSNALELLQSCAKPTIYVAMLQAVA